MEGLKYLIIVANRENKQKYIDFLKSCGATRVFSELCRGTATANILNYMGLEQTEKVMLKTFVRAETVPTIKERLRRETDITLHGAGIGVFIPIDAVGGKTALNYLTGDMPVKKKEKSEMKENKLVLIITIADKGNVELIMDAARSAGASGGTVVRATGTGTEISKFFGVSISEEKDMIYIVAKKEQRDGIMRAIMEKAGSDTPAHGVAFSVPVESVTGIRSLENI